MLTPLELSACADDVVELYDKLNNEICADIARRIVKTGKLSSTAQMQAVAANQAGLLQEDIIDRTARASSLSNAQVKAVFQDALQKTTDFDLKIYELANIYPIKSPMSPQAMQIIEANYRKTNNMLQNLTLTMPLAGQQSYIAACTAAEMQVESGAFSLDTAVTNAVKILSSQTDWIYYQGRRTRCDVAVRRAVRTGVGVTCGKISELWALDMGCDLMELSAHTGARPEHAAWQGKLVSLSGRRGYLSLNDIGYGTATGFKGVNCRHDWFPFFEGISQRAHTDEELEAIDSQTVSYNGRSYTLYEAEQKMRAYERRIRDTKRELITLNAAKDEMQANAMNVGQIERELKRSADKLKRQQDGYLDFCRGTNQLEQKNRTQVYGFNRSVAQKTAWQRRKNTIKPIANSVKSGIIKQRGALNSYDSAAEKHAIQYYEAVRHMKTDTIRISANTKIAKDKIDKIKNYIFVDTHELFDGNKRFYPSFDIAQSWQRLIDGKTQKKDIILLKHEYAEIRYTEKGLTQNEAHIKASRKYNYSKYCD